MKKIVNIFLIVLLLGIYNIGVTNSNFTDQARLVINTFSTKCWVAPTVPTLVYPHDNTIAGLESAWDRNPYMDWEDSTTTCPLQTTITYQYESYYDSGLTSLAYQSGWLTDSQIPAPGTPDGTYYWHVRAKDNHGNISSFSLSWKLVVDRVAPLTPSLKITGSFTKAVDEKLTNGGFETGDLTGWTTAGNVSVGTTDPINNPSTTVSPNDGSYMAKIGSSDDPGNLVWENRLMQSFDSGAKALSLDYNFFSRDYSPNDQPGFFIRLNGQEVFRQNSLESDGTNALNTGWQQFYYDLSNQNSSKVNLSLYAGNTGDTNSQSWAYIDKVTTYFISAPSDAKYYISGSDNPGGSGINHYEYSLDGSTWNNITVGGYFQLLTGGDRMIYYRSVDNAGNYTAAVPVQVITDTTPPSTISDLAISSTGANFANLSWTAPGNDGSSGRAASYDVRYSTTNISDDASFNAATKVDKIPSPQSAGSTETLEITGLNPSTTYYFAIKSSDEAPNTSSLSNVPSVTTTSGATVNAGDVVINELMWSGTKTSTDDQYIELRNMTDHEIDLSNFTLDKYNGSTDVLMLTIPAGKKIVAKGYFLISNFAPASSDLKDSISVDYVTTDVDLSATNLSIKLYDTGSSKIDEAWNGTAPTEGLYDTTVGSEKYYSMERISVPGDGSNPLSWYTCIDSASTTDFFDGGADERGTPGAENRSENEPLAHQTEKLRPSPSPTDTPSVTETPDVSPTVDETVSPTVTPEVVSPTPDSITPTITIAPTSEPTQTPEVSPSPTTSPVDPSPEISP